jgi:DNA polymerase-3 subunit gamma/tau
MSAPYQVLARKWRPHNFNDMVGQEHILRMLSNALEQKRLHHAYLLTGTRGVGKTTLARILAKCLNCETGITPTPCDTCSICKAIDAGQFLDLFEIDAASRTKVEDTRELLDNVMYQPSQGRYKVYLIDEVHMLSNHSFNALLKTLEEPPEYVKFILATTDPKRLPITILSRCLQFHLKRIVPEQIAAHLQHICTTEKIAFETPAFERLAKAADGSMRDALSLLDQAIAYGHGAVNTNDVNAMLGSMAQDDLLPLLDALAGKSGKSLFDAIHQLAEHAPDFQQVLEELISLLHHLAVAQIVPDAKTLGSTLQAYVPRFSAEELQLYYQIALLGRRDLAYAATPQQGFEMTMLRMLAFKPNLGVTENKPAATAVVAAINPIKPTAEPKETPRVVQDNARIAEWCDILPKLELTGMAYALASNCLLSNVADNKVELTLSANHQPMLNDKLKERLIEALGRYFKQPMQLNIHITTADLPATPVKQHESELKSTLANAKQAILDNPSVKQLIDMYDATVEVSLV